MNRLPPSSPASLPSAFFSFLVHAAVVVGGIMVAPHVQTESESTPMVYIPIELVTIADSTNLTAVAAAAQQAEEDVEQAARTEASPAPALPPPDEDTVSFEPPKEQPREQPKKAEARPTPPTPARSFNSELDDILTEALKDQPKTKNNSAATAPATSSAPEAPRLSAGDKRRMTASVADAIRSQLISNRCWADHSDMADARRLKATFRVWFGRNGKFSQKYQLVSPAREPFNDPPMQAFITHARRALDMCNNIGWQVPEAYFQLPQPQYVDLEFLPKIGATQ
jgi:outer membrane biosynthesis protein TonB